MPQKNLTTTLCLLGCLLLASSCVKDVDFDQDDEFLVSPDIAIDLAHFRFYSEYFLDTENLPVQERVDTLGLNMMDQDLVNELDSVQFYFSYVNTFRRSFNNKYIFYSDQYETLYEVPTLHVQPGSPENPHEQDTTVVITGDLMHRLKDAAHLEIRLSIGDEPTAADGLLTAQVIAIYNFSEFEI